MTEGIPRYPDQDNELLTDNEIGLAEAMNECTGVGVGMSSMEAARKQIKMTSDKDDITEDEWISKSQKGEVRGVLGCMHPLTSQVVSRLKIYSAFS